MQMKVTIEYTKIMNFSYIVASYCLQYSYVSRRGPGTFSPMNNVTDRANYANVGISVGQRVFTM